MNLWYEFQNEDNLSKVNQVFIADRKEDCKRAVRILTKETRIQWYQIIILKNHLLNIPSFDTRKERPSEIFSDDVPSDVTSYIPSDKISDRQN